MVNSCEYIQNNLITFVEVLQLAIVIANSNTSFEWK